MKTLDQILEHTKNKDSELLDNRDYQRLLKYIPVKDWEVLGFSLKEGAEEPEVEAFTEESVLSDLTRDLEFAFEKALSQRGISASLMYEVIKMWMWVLEDDLQYEDDYAYYGLPLLKKVAVKYGLDNPIGDDEGSEEKYDTRM